MNRINEWLFQALQNGTCPICGREGSKEYSLGNGELKFCSEYHLIRYKIWWYDTFIVPRW